MSQVPLSTHGTSNPIKLQVSGLELFSFKDKISFKGRHQLDEFAYNRPTRIN